MTIFSVYYRNGKEHRVTIETGTLKGDNLTTAIRKLARDQSHNHTGATFITRYMTGEIVWVTDSQEFQRTHPNVKVGATFVVPSPQQALAAMEALNNTPGAFQSWWKENKEGVTHDIRHALKIDINDEHAMSRLEHVAAQGWVGAVCYAQDQIEDQNS